MKMMNMYGVFHQYSFKKKIRWMGAVEVIIALLLLTVLSALIYENISSKMDKSTFKMKGKLYDAGGYKLFSRTSGDGKATVVLESDIGDPSLQWIKVSDTLSKNLRVVSYDRAGYGWSDSSTSPRTITQEVKELHTVLKKSTAKAPYILVGHGYGGLIMMRYAKEYPDEVGGLILLDTPSESYIAGENFKETLEKELKETKYYKYASYLGIPRAADRMGKLPENTEVLSNLKEEDKAFYKSYIITPKYYNTLYNELNEYKQYDDKVQAQGLLGEKLVFIFSSPKNELSTEKQTKWMEGQKELLQLSSKSEFSVVDDSSTYIQLDKPDVVINAVNSIMKKIIK